VKVTNIASLTRSLAVAKRSG